MSRRALPLLLTLFFLLWGSWLRLGALGHAPFSTDESIQYFASRGVQQQGAPVLPSGTDYHRGIDYSRMAAVALKHLGPPELAARLPAALIGVLDLVLLTLIAGAMAGPWAAVWAAAIGGIYPETVHLSRYARFYTLQLAFGLLALYAGWRMLREPVPAPPTPPGPSLRRQWGWLLGTLLAFALAAREQIVTLSTAAGFCALLAVFGLADWRRMGRDAWTRSVALQTAAAGLLAAVVVAVLKPDLAGYLFWRAGAVPLWAELSSPGGGSVTAYYRALSQHYPLAVSLLPLTALLLLIRRPRLGLFLGFWFGVPLLLHSVVFPWKAERYILLAVPAFLLATAVAAAWGSLALFRFLQNAFGGRTFLAAAAVATVALVAWVTQPAFNDTRREVHAPPVADWHASVARLRQDSTLSSLPWGNASPLPALFYWGRLDFTVQRGLLESWSRAEDSTSATPGGFERKPVGTPDVYAGVPVLPTPSSLRDRFRGAAGVVIGFEEKYATFDNLSPGLVDTLAAQATEICQGKCGTIRLYVWRWKTPATGPGR